MKHFSFLHLCHLPTLWLYLIRAPPFPSLPTIPNHTINRASQILIQSFLRNCSLICYRISFLSQHYMFAISLSTFQLCPKILNSSLLRPFMIYYILLIILHINFNKSICHIMNFVSINYPSDIFKLFFFLWFTRWELNLSHSVERAEA